MKILNDKLVEALRTGKYYCPECGALMEFYDEQEDLLICTNCSKDVPLDMYGFDSLEDYEKCFPTEDDFE